MQNEIDNNELGAPATPEPATHERSRSAASPPVGECQAQEVEKPLGWEAALADWNEPFSGRPMAMRDWTSLTIGEQMRYAASECKTKGAVYSSHVSGRRIAFTIDLPENLALDGLSEAEARGMERHLHRKLETYVASILTLRQFKREADAYYATR